MGSRFVGQGGEGVTELGGGQAGPGVRGESHAGPPPVLPTGPPALGPTPLHSCGPDRVHSPDSSSEPGLVLMTSTSWESGQTVNMGDSQVSTQLLI